MKEPLPFAVDMAEFLPDEAAKESTCQDWLDYLDSNVCRDTKVYMQHYLARMRDELENTELAVEATASVRGGCAILRLLLDLPQVFVESFSEAAPVDVLEEQPKEDEESQYE